MRVVYFPVHNPEYPRNRLIREHLASAGIECVVIDRGHGAFESATWRKKLSSTVDLFRESRRANVIVLSELSNQYALIAWIAAALSRSMLVVDGFVGLYETRVEDWGKYPPRSIRARALHFLDYLAYRLPALYLTDTKIRAHNVAARHGGRTRSLSLPVGAPDWAQPPKELRRREGDEILLLHYGNFAPLHGVETIIEAMSILRQQGHRVYLKIVGDGKLRPEAERQVQQKGLADCCSFTGRVSETELLPLLWECDLMLGVFGESDKAGSVIPNKVWQGLAAGRGVVTRHSVALDEIASIVGSQLATVPAGDPGSLASAIMTSDALSKVFPESSDRLSGYVDEEFADFIKALKELGERPHPIHEGGRSS